MKTIIAGSRRLDTDHELVWLVADAVAKSGFQITEVVSGGARGIDLAGEVWAETSQPSIPFKRFLPNWALGKHAGFLRNKQMVDYAEALIAIRSNHGAGTSHTIKLAIDKGIMVFVMDYEGVRPNEPSVWKANC